VSRTAGNDDRSSVPILRCSQERPASAARTATPTASVLLTGPSLAGHARAAGTGRCSSRVASCSLLISWTPHDPQKRFVGGFSWRQRGHGTCCSVMVCLSSFPCPNIFSLYTSLYSICAPQPSEEVSHLMSEEAFTQELMGIPPASPAPSLMRRFAGLSRGRYCNELSTAMGWLPTAPISTARLSTA
jgi:hypothetical protein